MRVVAERSPPDPSIALGGSGRIELKRTQSRIADTRIHRVVLPSVVHFLSFGQ